MADGRRGRQQLEELSPAVASLAVSVITVTVLLTVIAHGPSAEPLARRYGAAAGPGGNGDHGAALGRVVHPPAVPSDRRGNVPVPHHDQVAGDVDLLQAGGLLTQLGSRPVP